MPTESVIPGAYKLIVQPNRYALRWNIENILLLYLMMWWYDFDNLNVHVYDNSIIVQFSHNNINKFFWKNQCPRMKLFIFYLCYSVCCYIQQNKRYRIVYQDLLSSDLLSPCTLLNVFFNFLLTNKWLYIFRVLGKII